VEIEIECQNYRCNESFTEFIEGEGCGQGTEHIVSCPNCGSKTKFTIEYDAYAYGESLVGEQPERKRVNRGR